MHCNVLWDHFIRSFFYLGGERIEGEIDRGRLSKAEASGDGDGLVREGRDSWD